MNRQLPFSITEEQKQRFSTDGVVCLRGLFDDDWIGVLTAGIEKNLSDPGQRSRIWDRTADNRTMFYDSDNWRRIPEYEQFVYHSPCVDIATALLTTDRVNFIFDAVFVRSTGVTFPTPWHQDEPYWSAGGMDTVSIWMPLVPVSRESALAFVPGSHLWPNHFRQRDFGELNPDRQQDVNTVSFSGDWARRLYCFQRPDHSWRFRCTGTGSGTQSFQHPMAGRRCAGEFPVIRDGPRSFGEDACRGHGAR